ncbi:peroxide stress protein YaaA [Actinotalea sp. BY-33]|uniref:Peroxide stress protein YaaA n=1 Tax=Actinotalea soli TaxID=2819234 RepID=A0A939RT80_9CELL|nr:peroxide stress protein YaaA [Actinotalea soli]MBO1750654.1 peroxide stress protein YaaA [Actinotalea soli]
MLVLLPPSEGKTAPRRGKPVDLSSLSAPGLTEPRTRVLEALLEASARPDAVDLLGVGPSLAAEVERNLDLRAAPTAAARSVYTGVLYGAARLDDLPAAARRRARASVRTVSALWGLVSPEDRIPAYRLSMGTDLPGIGRLAQHWRPALRAELDPEASHRLVVDCRSAAYAAAWPVPAGGPGHVSVVVHREAEGRRTVVSHWAKHTRGVLTRHLVTREGTAPRSPEELLDAAGELVGGALLDAGLTEGPRGSSTLALVVADPTGAPV